MHPALSFCPSKALGRNKWPHRRNHVNSGTAPERYGRSLSPFPPESSADFRNSPAGSGFPGRLREVGFLAPEVFEEVRIGLVGPVRVAVRIGRWSRASGPGHGGGLRGIAGGRI